jgi:hypothetical protein
MSESPQSPEEQPAAGLGGVPGLNPSEATWQKRAQDWHAWLGIATVFVMLVVFVTSGNAFARVTVYNGGPTLYRFNVGVAFGCTLVALAFWAGLLGIFDVLKRNRT